MTTAAQQHQHHRLTDAGCVPQGMSRRPSAWARYLWRLSLTVSLTLETSTWADQPSCQAHQQHNHTEKV